MKRLLFNICVAILLSQPVLADEPTPPPPLDFKGVYEFGFAGLLFGRMGIEAEQTADHYSVISDIASAGIVKIFAPHSSHTQVDATGKDFTYPYIIYDTKYQTKKKKKAVHLVYKDGKIIEETIFPKRRENRPPVPGDIKNKAFDPLSLNLALRQRIWHALQTGKDNQFDLTVYDGRRATHIDVSVAGKKLIRMGEEKVFAIQVAVRRKLLAGFTEEELADYDPREPTLWMYYSDDDRLIPLKVEVGFLFGKLTGTLVKECRTGESCLLGIKE